MTPLPRANRLWGRLSPGARVTPHRFVDGRWVAAPALPATPVSSVSVVTLNTWFKEHARDARLDAQHAWLEAHQPDVIALQEVLPDQLHALLAAPWFRAAYHGLPDPGLPLAQMGYGVALFVKAPVTAFAYHPLPSAMGRGLLTATLPGGLTVGTVHLESRRPNHAARTAQLEAITALLSPAQAALLVGDFNFDDDDAHPSPQGPWTDLWATCRPDHPGYTADEVINPMRFAGRPPRPGGPQRRRIDRLWLLDRTRQWRVADIDRMGVDPIAPDTWMSDHFGLTVCLERGQA